MKFLAGVRHFTYLWKGAGPVVALRTAGASCVSLVYLRKRWYLTVVRLDPNYVTPPEALVDSYGTRTLIVTDVGELESYRSEFHEELDYEHVRSFFDIPGNRFVALARRPQPDGSGQVVVAYRLCERGRFRFWEDKVDLKLGPEFFTVHNKTVAPECRGQNLSEFMRRALFDYCRKEGMRTQVGMIGVHNAPSIRSFYKHDAGYTPATIGVIQRVRIFHRLIDRHTPEPAIGQLVLEHAPPAEGPTRFEIKMALVNPAAATPVTPPRQN